MSSPKKQETDAAVEMGKADTGMVSKLLEDPQMMAALQYNLNKYVGATSGYIESLPKCVKRRIKALKNIQLEYTKLEIEFFKEVHELENKYHERHVALYEKRLAVTSGAHEPTDEEADFKLDEDEAEEEELSKDLDKKASIEGKEKEDPKGVPEFWLTIFKNVDLLMEMVQDHDQPILSKLKDIKLTLPKDSMGFTLEFHFDENDYFTNKVLTKHYEMKCEPAANDPFSFEGPEITHCKGCSIDWKKGKNVTLKTVKKKQKHKSRGSTRTITKTVANDSFFNFFSPPTIPDDPDEDMDDETQTLLMADYEIGHYIRERIIPRAVLYFTGEALEDEDYEEEGDEMEEEELDEDDEDSHDPDYNPATDKKKGPAGADPNQCPNQ